MPVIARDVAREPRRRRSGIIGWAFAAGAVWASCTQLSDPWTFVQPGSWSHLVQGDSRARSPAMASGRAHRSAHRAPWTALRAEGLTVEEFKARLRERPFGKRARPSRLGRVLAEFVDHLEKVVAEEPTGDDERTLRVGTAQVNAEGDRQAEEARDAEALFAQLKQIDPLASTGDYFDERSGSWDVQGLREDWKLAQQRQPQQQQQQPQPQIARPEELQFAELQALDPHASKEDYFADGEWNMEGLSSGLALARTKAESLPEDPAGRQHAQEQQHEAPQPEELELAELLALDQYASKEDYFSDGVWDVEGLRSDLALAKAKVQSPPADPAEQQFQRRQQPAPQPGELEFAELRGLDPHVSKEDYFSDGQWDMEGLRSDLALAKAKAQGLPELPDKPGQSLSPSPPEPESVVAPGAASFAVGDQVLAVCEEDGNYYAAAIVAAKGTGGFLVKWDEDGEESAVPASRIKALPSLDFESPVRAIWEGDGGWHFGMVLKFDSNGKYLVRYDEDGTSGYLTTEQVRPYEEGPEFWAAPFSEGDPAPAVGEATQALWKDGSYEGYHGVVVQQENSDGTFTVKWDEDSSESVVKRDELRTMRPRVSSDSYTKGQKMKGVVVEVVQFGAFVDVGLTEGRALVHTSKLADRFVLNPDDVVAVGQDVTVWCMGKNDKGQLDLTMSEQKLDPSVRGNQATGADLSDFTRISPTEWLPGKVVTIMNFGAIVDCRSPQGAVANGLVHATEITTKKILSVEAELQVGQHVQVRVLSVDVADKKLRLSMRPFPARGTSRGR